MIPKLRKKSKPPKALPLKKWLEKRGSSQAWLYRRLITYFGAGFPEISYTTFNRIVRGEREAPASMVTPVAEITGIDADEVRQLLKLKVSAEP